MAEQSDLEFSVGVVANTGPLTAELQRLTRTMNDMGASVNLARPFDEGAQAARRAGQAFRSIDLELVNIERAAERVGDSYGRQQVQLRKVEEAIRTIRNLPITTQKQFDSLTQLEAIQVRLNTAMSEARRATADPRLGLSPLAAIDPAVFQGISTVMARFKGELKDVELAERQLIEATKVLRDLLKFQGRIDPALIQSVQELREQLQLTGPAARTAFNNVMQGAREVIRSEEQLAKATLDRAAVQQRAAATYEAALAKQQKLLIDLAALPRGTAESAALAQRVSTAVQPTEDPRLIAERSRNLSALRREFELLKVTMDGLVATERNLQTAGQAVSRAEQEAAVAFQARAAARERANRDYLASLLAQQRLLQAIAKLPVGPARDDLRVRAAAPIGPTDDPRALQAVNLELARLKAASAEAGTAVESTGKKMATTTSIIDKMTTRLGNHLQIVASIGVAYAAFNTLMAVVQHFVELDEAMHRISATISDQEESARLLPRAYALIQQGMTQFGLSTEDAGKLVLELTRSLSDLTQVNAAFLPALALTVRGEVNMADATKVLIGSVNAFGAELIGVTDPLEAYGAAADKIIRASNLSVGSIGTFSVALTNLAGRASVTNTTFSETLAALSLVQDSLGRAGQSGTGLARVFEGLLLHAGQLAEIFDVAFDPARAVNPIDLLTKTFAKLREEIKLTGGVSSETEAKIQKIIGTEQGTRIIELLVKDWEKFPARLKAITDSSGQHLKELKEHNEQLGVSFKNLTNSALVAVDTILVAFAKIGGGEGGTPGQFTGLAQAFNTIAAGFLQFGRDVEAAATGIKKIIDAIANLRPPPNWFSLLIGAPAGTPAASALDKVVADIGSVGKALSFLPEPPDWLMRMLGFGAAVAVGGLVGGPVGAVALGGAQLLTQYSIDAETAQKAADKLTTSANAAARAMAIQSGHDPAAISDQAAEAERNVEVNRARMLRDRLALLGELETKSTNEIRQRSGELSIFQQIAAAHANAAKSEKDYQDARAKYADAQKLSNLGEKDAAAAFDKLSGLKRKSVTDQQELNALQKTYNEGQRKQADELAKLATDREEALDKLKQQLESLATLDPLSQIFIKGKKQFDELFKELDKKGLPGFAEQNRGLIQAVVDAQMKQSAEKLYEGLVSPYRTAAETNNDILAKLIYDTENAYNKLGNQLSFDKRTELRTAPDRAIDKQIGADKVTNDLRAASAVIGQFGEDAAKAMFAASQGLASFDDLIEEASLRLHYMGDTALTRVIDRFILMRAEISKLDLKQVTREFEVAGKALEAAFEIGPDPVLIEANNRALQKTGLTLKELGKSADENKRKFGEMLIPIVKQDLTKSTADQLTQQLIDLKGSTDGVIASFGQVGAQAIATQLTFTLMAKGVDTTSVAMQGLIQRTAVMLQQQKSLETAKGLQAIGFSESTARNMAEAITLQDELNKKIDDGTAALKKWNDMSESAHQRELALIKETAKSTGDVFTFLGASFEQAATQGHTFWDDMETMAKSAASGMASSMSDIFFALIQNKTTEAKAAFKNFFLGLLRNLLDFLSSQAVADFAKLFLGIGKGATGALSGAFGGGGGGGAAASPLAPAGTTLSLGVSSPQALAASGFDIEDTVHGLQNFTTGLGISTTALQTMTGSSTAFSSVMSSIAAGWNAGEGIIGGFTGAVSGGFTGLQTAITGMSAASTALAGVGAALSIFDNIMAGVNGRMAEFSTRLVLGVAGGVAGGIFGGPAGALLGIVVGDTIGKWISKLFGTGPSNYEIKRQKAENTAVGGIQQVTAGYTAAAKTTDTSVLFNAIKGSAQGVGTILLASPELASRLGIDVSKYGEHQVSDGKFEVSWSDVTQAQFDELLRVLKEDPTKAQGLIGGRVNVPYLQQDKVGGFQQTMADVAEALLAQFAAFAKMREEIKKLNDDISEAVKDFLPPDIAENFRTKILDPISQQILDTIADPKISVETAQAKLKAYETTLQAYLGLTDLYGQITRDIALNTGDFVDAMVYADTLIERMQNAADKRITKAAKDVGVEDLVKPGGTTDFNTAEMIEKVKAAFKKMDLTPVQAFERLAELRNAVVARYELEKKLVIEAEANIAQLYQTHMTSLLSLDQVLSDVEISTSGTYTNLQSIVMGFLNLAEVSLSVPEKIYAVTAALKLFIASLPTLIQGINIRASGPEGPPALPVDQILNATLAVVVPFAATLNTQIRNAFDAGDFETAFNLLQQLGEGLVSAMNAAIAGVRQWEQQQIGIINKEADRRIKVAGDVRDQIQKGYDAQKKVIDLQIQAIDLQKQALEDRKTALEDEIFLVRSLMKPLEDQIKGITRQQEALRRTMRPLDAQIRAIGDAMKPIQQHVDALNEQAKMLQRNADDQLWNIKIQTDALNKQRDTIQDQIDLIEEMANAVQSVRDYLKDLALGQQAPPDAVGQFQIAQSSFESLFADFMRDPNAKKLGDLQGSAQDYLNSLGGMFDRPSEEYRKFYEEIVKKLEEAAAVGAGIGDPATLDDLKEQLKAVDDQLDDLNEASELINQTLEYQLHAIELQKRPLEDALELHQKQIDAINDQKQLIQDQIDILEIQKEGIQDLLDQGEDYIGKIQDQIDILDREETLLNRQEQMLQRELGKIADAEEDLNKKYQEYVDGINTLRKDAIEAVHGSADAMVSAIKEALMPLIQAAAIDAHLFFEWMRNEQYARLMDLTNGQGSAAWLRTAQQSMVSNLGALNVMVQAFINGDMQTIVHALTAPQTTDQLLISTLGNVATTMGNLDGSIQALNSLVVNAGGPNAPHNPPSPPESPGGGFATGAWNVTPGMYELHAGEMVAPRAQAEALRSAADGWAEISRLAENGGGGSNTYITISPVIHSNQNPAMIVHQVIDRIVVDIRGGGVIQEAIARMPKRSR